MTTVEEVSSVEPSTGARLATGPAGVIAVAVALFSNFTAAMNHASQSGANTVFTIDANDTVTLDNVTKTSLTAGNFHFT